MLAKKPKAQSFNNDFLSHLERKYCGQAVYNDDSSESNACDNGGKDDDDSDDNSGLEAGGGDDLNAKQPQKKRKNMGKNDFYDEDDDWIDDSEDRLITQLSIKNFATKHSGFFVSAGNLDVEKRSNIELVKPKKKANAITATTAAPATASTTTSSNKATTNSNTVKEPVVKSVSSASVSATSSAPATTTSAKKKIAPIPPAMSPTRSSKSTTAAVNASDKTAVSNGNANVTNITVGATTATDTTIPPSPSGAGSATAAQRVIKPKLVWSPIPSVVAQIDSLKDFITELRVTCKSISLSDIEDKLLSLDNNVRCNNLEVWNSSNAPIGYFESISELIFKESKPKVMKTILLNIAMKQVVKVIKSNIENKITNVIAELKTCVGKYSPPPSSAATEAKDNEAYVSVDSIKDTDYEFVCKWKANVKHVLIELDALMTEYVKMENKYRTNLTAQEKKEMLEDADEIDVKKYVAAIHNDICLKSFPKKCKNATSAYLRRVVGEERSKEKKKAKEVESSGSALPVSATVTTVSAPIAATVTATAQPSTAEKRKSVGGKKKDGDKVSSKKSKVEAPVNITAASQDVTLSEVSTLSNVRSPSTPTNRYPIMSHVFNTYVFNADDF